MRKITHLVSAASVLLFATMDARSDDHGNAAAHGDHPGKGSAYTGHGDHHGFTPLGGLNLSEGWFDAPSIRHETADGNLIIFPFGMAPGFLSRDLFLDYIFADLDGADLHEFELELELPLTRRIGFAIKAPYFLVRPDQEMHLKDADGWGDLSFSPRFLLADTDRSSTTFNFGVIAPTGSESIGAGDQVQLAPSISDWRDLGGGFAFHTQVGVGIGIESDEVDLFYRAGLTKAFGDLSLAVQIDGSTVLEEGDGHEGDGHTDLSGLAGATYRIGEGLDLRAAYLFPVNNESILDGGLRVGIIRHF